jgi:hypothetical protein
MKDRQVYHHLLPTSANLGVHNNQKATFSLDTTSTLSITTLASAKNIHLYQEY